MQQQIHRIAGELHVSGPKSDRSRHVLALVPSVVEALREHGHRHDIEREAAAGRWRDSGLVFTTTLGAPLGARTVIREYHAVLAVAGLDGVGSTTFVTRAPRCCSCRVSRRAWSWRCWGTRRSA